MNGLTVLIMILFRVFLGGVFAYSGLIKLIEPVENFIHSLSQYTVIPQSLAPMIANVFPWVEFILGSFLILGYAPRISALMLAFLSGGLVVVIASSGLLWGTGHTSCGCFGQSGLQISARQIFLVDISNVIIGFRLFFIQHHPFSLDQWLRKKN